MNKKKSIISVSFLSADQGMLKEELESVGTADYFHVDVMDGRFVPRKTYCPEDIISLELTVPLDVHLMVDKPENMIDDWLRTGPSIVVFHYEATTKHKEIIAMLHKQEVKAGISVKPGTPAKVLFPFLATIDLVLVMTVEPGAAGQSFMPEMLEKVRGLRKAGFKGIIEVDGGITLENQKKAKLAGADMFVSASFIFKHKDRKAIIRQMQEV
ncbi:ribulose-phosphate 3-epimerase [Candidatus Woesearchaeota archaeon]|nr:MAG: ribulose-phosphate 3-epimerase, ribulose-phosphate 3-epimerase [archaeon GW2011_AR4]MBS3129427.1 ribulose-phosphate 3-epimerase [Candidatus Woesearchaeota archaeon]HIH38468.1 ribulose-phosphate 3-epimerase [Candidatus Woesearchaeota archaeon]HIH49792.1 ribulose-phosphate 3-epimerase [Candidatus Woesearchaeota archaeon]HIJ03481.1 ribulose-phosphate 3-epimerase [Candidatus Woesearchaeota archaeon]